MGARFGATCASAANPKWAHIDTAHEMGGFNALVAIVGTTPYPGPLPSF